MWIMYRHHKRNGWTCYAVNASNLLQDYLVCLSHLKPVRLRIHVSDVDSSFVTEKELFTLPVGVDAHVIFVTLFVGNERLHDKGVQDASHNFHLCANTAKQ